MQLPLFPLNTVLFPGGVLPLRVFEARYMDMVRQCMKRTAPFGVVLITRGGEVGAPAATESVGTLARIAAWDMPQLGLLHLRAVGGDRFRIEQAELQPDGLQLARVEPIAPDDDSPLGEQYRPCADLLQRVIDDVVGQRTEDGDDAQDPINSVPFEAPYRFDSSVWVGNRLCEFMPIPLRARQKLMELQDATSRLQLVHRFLVQHGVLKSND
ncbi:MAG: LON peptidase substrate-binding domain-containing protein [Burkholderiales bacterium]|jgi:Lon protease-like protein|nr:LON peptidase substrate-binding domain-containing protein [Burkholderiales bacterium]